MRRRSISPALALAIIFTTLSPAFADASEALPEPLIKAAAAYKAKGAGHFLPTLIKGSRLQHTDKLSLSQADSLFNQIESHYGKYLGIEMVGTIPISDSTRVVYFVIAYERGPLYGVADLYRTPHGEIVTNSNVNTELGRILPPEIIGKIR